MLDPSSGGVYRGGGGVVRYSFKLVTVTYMECLGVMVFECVIPCFSCNEVE